MSNNSVNPVSFEETLRNTTDPDNIFLFALDYVRQENMGNTADNYLRIGDTVLSIPPQAISVRQQTKGRLEDVLRTPGGIVMSSGWSYEEVMMTMTFNGTETIFGMEPNAVAKPQQNFFQRIGLIPTPPINEPHTTQGVDIDPLTGRMQPPRLNGPYDQYRAVPIINPNSLAALIAQFKKTPILPVVNTFLNKNHGISELALSSIMVETPMNESGDPIPNTLRVVLIAKATQIETHCPGILNLENAIIWPLQRWYWRSEFANYFPGEWRQFYKINPDITPEEILQAAQSNPDSQQQSALDGDQPGSLFLYTYPGIEDSMSNGYCFSTVSQRWLDAIARMRKTLISMLDFTYTDAFTKLSEAEQGAAYNNLASWQALLAGYIGADAAKMEEFFIDPNRLILRHMSVVMDNNFAPIQIPGSKNPAYQHLSRGDAVISATFWAADESVLAMILELVDKSKQLIREQRFEVVSGFVGFENEIASLFGCRYVVFTDIQTRTVEDVPDTYLVTIQMAGFNRFQRRYEALKSSTDIADFGAPLLQNMTGVSSDYDPQYAKSLSFYGRLFGANTDNSPWDPQYTDNGNNPFDPMGRPINAWFNGAYIQQAKEQLAELEIYPDLQLPKYERLMIAIDNEIFLGNTQEAQAQKALQTYRYLYWSNGGRYVDPDFYVDYPNTKLASQINLQQIDDTTTTSYLSIAASQFATITENTFGPEQILYLEGSIASSLSDVCRDDMPDLGIFGPHPADTRAMVQRNDNPDQAINTTVGVNASGTVSQNPRILRHGTVKFPKPGADSQGGIIKIPSGGNAPAFDAYRQGSANTHFASDDEINSIGFTDRINALKQQANYDQLMSHHIDEVFGAGTSSVSNNTSPQPGDKQGLLNQAILAAHPVDMGNTMDSDFHRMVGMMSDLFEYDVSGRLVQAYPGYVFQLIDEGPQLGWSKLFPNFWAAQCIQSIDIIQDRRDPAHTAMIEMMNMYGNFSSYSSLQLDLNAIANITDWQGKILSPIVNAVGDIFHGGNIAQNLQESVQDLIGGLERILRDAFPTISVFGVKEADGVAELRRRQRNQIMISPGVRIHVRAGYGANGANYPILFNGRIAEVEYGERVRMIAQGDGVELLKQLPHNDDISATLNPPSQGRGLFIATGFEPRHIICTLLSSHNPAMLDYSFWGGIVGIWQNVSSAFFNGAVFQNNPIGIQHFGNPYMFDFHAAWSNGTDFSQVNDTNSPHYNKNELRVNKDIPTIKGLVQNNRHSNYRMANAYSPTLSEYPTSSLSKLWPDIGELAVGALVGGPAGLFAVGMNGPFASLFNSFIPQGYGETGENVYPPYTPFQMWMNHFGSVFNLSSAMGIFDPQGSPTAIQQLGTAAAIASMDNLAQATPPNITPENDVGLLHYPGVCFNMFINNKTVWDVVSLAAQCMPPYIASVRPFEYRSTLFFGAPYYLYRYDYHRVTSTDLGTVQGYDKFFGYPYGYKLKPHLQFHYVDSNINMLSNNIRASEDDTYTDVIALWYKGVDKPGTKPDPVSENQTVDQMIMPALRKTAVVNTDYVGADVPPTGPAVLATGGTAYLAYMLKTASLPFGQWGSINGQVNFHMCKDTMRKTTRSILRDYQKLMYQGTLLLRGDPTIKPYDIMFLNDSYNFMTGLCGVRRVVWHFSFETGFVTSVEPDLLCEVKDDNLQTSIWCWLGGFIGPNLVAIITSKILKYRAVRRLSRAIMGLIDEMLNPVKTTSLADKGLNFVKKFLPTKWLAGTQDLSELNRSQAFLYTKNRLVSFMESILSKSDNYNNFNAFVKQLLIDTKTTIGSDTGEALASDAIKREFSDVLAESLDKYSGRFVEQATIRALQGSLGKLQGGISISIEDAINELAFRTFLALGLENYLNSTRPLFSLLDLGNATKLAANFAKNFTTTSLQFIAKRFGIGVGAQVAEEVTKVGVSGVADIGADALVDGGVIAAATVAVPVPVVGTLIGVAIDVIINLTIGMLFTQVSRWWDDQYSLNISFLKYRGQEFQAGLNGHRPSLVIKATDDSEDEDVKITAEHMQLLTKNGNIGPRSMAQDILDTIDNTNGIQNYQGNTGLNIQNGFVAGGGLNLVDGSGNPIDSQNIPPDRRRLLQYLSSGQLTLEGGVSPLQISTVPNGSIPAQGINDNLVKILLALLDSHYRVQVSSMIRNEAGSDHQIGLAVDIDYIDGESTDGGQITDFLRAISGLIKGDRQIFKQILAYPPAFAQDLAVASGCQFIGSAGSSGGNQVGIDPSGQPHTHLAVNPA